MRPLSKLENAVFIAGALLMVIGAAVYVFGWQGAPWIFAVGSLAFSAMQMLQRYEGRNTTLRRLRRIVIYSDLLFLLTALLMFANQSRGLFGLEWLTYVNYVHNNWVVTLLVAAVLQLYTTYRIAHELEKEAKKR